MTAFPIETWRLLLRPWRDADLRPFGAMCADAAVMRYLGPVKNDEQVARTVERQRAYQAELGHCFWVIERKDDGEFLGFCGLKPGPEGTPIANQVEIGWRLRADSWGQGYAREAAQASLDWAWKNLSAPGVAAITVTDNARSWGLMERLGMTRAVDEDFEHPALPEGDPLRSHVVYRIARPK